MSTLAQAVLLLDHARTWEVWDSKEQFEAFGQCLMPILTEGSVEVAGPPEMIDIHNIIERSSAVKDGCFLVWACRGTSQHRAGADLQKSLGNTPNQESDHG